MKKITFLLFASLVFSNAHAGIQCADTKLKISEKDGLFNYVDNLADYHVYYGSISAKKTGKISKVFVTKTCTKNSTSAYLVRFQAEASNNIFYCFSKVMTYSNGKVINNGTVCSLSKTKKVSTLDFPYNTNQDPYSNRAQDNSSPDDIYDGYAQPGRTGFEGNLDPFYNSYSGNSEGPDSRDGGGF